MDDEFFIILPSNVKRVIGTEQNKTAEYVTHLPSPLYLNDQYEVAISEIAYSNSFYNVDSSSNTFELHAPNREPVTFEIPIGKYEDTRILNETINSHLTNFQYKVRLGYKDEKFFFAVEPGSKIILTKKLSVLMGFEKNVFDNTNTILDDERANVIKRHYSSSFPDLKAHLHFMYVYSDLVKETLVGDQYTPLLRCVNVEGRFGEQVDHVFNYLYFKKINKFVVNDISIKLCDQTGDLMQFNYGAVLVTLCFRKKRKQTEPI